MPRSASWISCLVAILFGSVIPAQAQLSAPGRIGRACPGWQKMPVEHSNRVI